MKKKTMQTVFVILFIAGLIVGYILPGDIKTLTKKPLQPGIFDVPKKLGQLDREGAYFRYTVLAEAETGSIELLMLDEAIPKQMHPKENRFIYVYKGKAKGDIGNAVAEVGPGQLIAVPAGIPYSLERIGDSPVEIILFSTPPFVEEDAVLLEEK